MVYLYPKFIHEVSKNAALLNCLFKGFFSVWANEKQLKIVRTQTTVW